MVLEPFDKIIGGAALMEEQWLVQLFRQDDMLFQTPYLVFTGGFSQSAFQHSGNCRFRLKTVGKQLMPLV